MLDASLVLGICAGFFLITAYMFLQSGDEIPPILAGLGLVTVLRGWMIDQGNIKLIAFDYGVTPPTVEDAVVAANFICLGTLLLTLNYIIQSKTLRPKPKDSTELWLRFVARYQSYFWVGLSGFIIVRAYLEQSLSQQFADGQGVNSYTLLFKMAGSSVIIGAIILSNTVYKKSPVRFLIYGIAGALCLLTLTFNFRFLMLGWGVLLVFILGQRLRPLPRTGLYFVCLIILGVAFTTLGRMRNESVRESVLTEKLDAGTKSIIELEDWNFVDGFAMLSHVYPSELPYGYGSEHLEILFRPIPRSVWEDKPVGGWQQKLAKKYGRSMYNTGISPSIFGTFYAEGGWAAIVILSLLYGWLLARLMCYINGFHALLHSILKGAVVASILALFRGGDLAGTVAFVGMSYWPIIIAVAVYRRFVKQRRHLLSPLQTARA